MPSRTGSNASDSFEPVQAPDNESVGLSDPMYAAGRRQMLDLINRLQNTGVQADMDLPMIAVIGSQSAGKSSLIESISGITLPRASGTCTRCPTECRLSSSNGAWKCVVSLSFTTDKHGQPLGQARNEIFGDVIFDKSQVEDRLRRAQRAILNPGTAPSKFLDEAYTDNGTAEVAFSHNSISLQISGQNVADLSFVDLPGMIASGSDKEIIENLVKSYIKRPSCIILLTVACETDWENQKGFDLAQQFDPDGKRTIGVLTKPDRIGRGDHDTWISFITNEVKPLDNGWFSVKQPDTQAVQEGITWEEARAQEDIFFLQTSPWAGLDAGLRQQLGTANLTERLSAILSRLIAKRLPELQDELQALIMRTEEALQQLPNPPPADPVSEILRLVADFVQDFASHVEGTPDEDGLLQQIRPAQLEFKKAIRATAPNFRSVTSDSEIMHDSPAQKENAQASSSFLANEENAVTVEHNTRDAIYIDEVMDKALKAITRELPDHYPFVVANEYVKEIIDQWRVPARNLYDQTQYILVTHVKDIVARHFSKYSHGNLQLYVTTIILKHLENCGKQTMDQIVWLQELEKRPHTMNDHYFSDYKDKFLALYRGGRHTSNHGSIVANLTRFNALSRVKAQDSEFAQGAYKALSGLTEMGFNVKAPELLKLLPPDPLEPALQIMATVRAYFQVAYKRFIDNVPHAIDYELVLGMNRDHRLESVLYHGLGLTGPDANKRCREFLSEPPQIISRRAELEKRRERLESAKKELMNVWL
ncbi:hypothetical protein BDW22DRAFT_1170105 [Trametopsis cervina]|nr:hypothetical protein BDW22DRAFT_1170105 [Trametopsis cervina]